MVNNEINFVDVTTRDGNQSLWDATGLRVGMVLSIAPVWIKSVLRPSILPSAHIWRYGYAGSRRTPGKG